jgi:hypothetical protein
MLFSSFKKAVSEPDYVLFSDGMILILNRDELGEYPMRSALN